MNSPTPRAGLGSVLYGWACYAVGVAGLAYCILFLLGTGVPTAVDDPATRPWYSALAIDFGLVIGWGVQHSAMARPRFKRWLTRYVPQHAERVTYCLASGVTLAAVCLLWQPIDGVIWSVGAGVWATALTTASLAGWVFLLAATFAIDHFELFGISQVMRAFLGRPEPEAKFTERLMYRVVRHPIQTGVLVGVWFTPHMTVSHLLFAATMTLYIHVGLYFEERALLREFGDAYAEYMRRVPKLIPGARLLRARSVLGRVVDARP
ncbi:MAG: hypothetical protein AAF721_10660 [Myxococcota bacterium]